MQSRRGDAAALFDAAVPRLVEAAVSAAGGFEAADPATACPRCGEALGPGCRGPEDPNCPAAGAPWSRLHQLGPYAGDLSAWIARMKFRREWAWSGFFGARLAAAWLAARPGPEAPTPAVAFVPMPLRRRWHRGFNQARLMADALAAEAAAGGVPLRVVPLLRRRRHTPPQRGMSRQQRLRRMSRAFAAARPWPGRPAAPAGPVLLVDDVLTTGATLRAASATLRAAGHGPVEVAVAAVVPRRR
ncbi:putative competence protein F [Phycisphaera mikurensis NBRC 102666]|uniref:Putative competence protein F n=1 Tax=Phycisphaera mikurensis (strain NBRC 102666 / KCTC 22515 / FYK2301M01) TaxID=1142394 RepID=I0IBC0_PHYMF|nr:putative competence protein F [Phycisphaera mikurensis NBRC 102666]